MTTRREILGGAAALPAVAALARPAWAQAMPSLPDKANFDLGGIAYCDSAWEHPISRSAGEALRRYQSARGPLLDPYQDRNTAVREKFARLVNADVDEIAYVQNTTMGEQLVVRALGLPERGARIVTDTLHFFGSFHAYLELERQGCQLVWLRARDGRIDPDDIERAITKGTRLVSLSAVSTFNGFQHDLKRVCEIAHAHGALVYADIIHAAGAVPLDLHATGVDFAACSAYKWLMGDYGLAFLYARKDRQPLLRRTLGYAGALRGATYHVYPLDPPGDTIEDYQFADNAMGYFAFGHIGTSTVAQLDHSLDYVQALDPARINAYVQPMLTRLKQELPRLGYTLATPPETTAPIVTCVMRDAMRLQPGLKKAGVRIMTARNRFRVSLSVFNDMDDVDRVLAALGPAARYA